MSTCLRLVLNSIHAVAFNYKLGAVSPLVGKTKASGNELSVGSSRPLGWDGLPSLLRVQIRLENKIKAPRVTKGSPLQLLLGPSA